MIYLGPRRNLLEQCKTVLRCLSFHYLNQSFVNILRFDAAQSAQLEKRRLKNQLRSLDSNVFEAISNSKPTVYILYGPRIKHVTCSTAYGA